MTCGEGCSEERQHELTMAASYWMQQYQKLEQHVKNCGNEEDLTNLQLKIEAGGTF